MKSGRGLTYPVSTSILSIVSARSPLKAIQLILHNFPTFDDGKGTLLQIEFADPVVPIKFFLCSKTFILVSNPADIMCRAGRLSDKLDQLDFVWEITIVYQDKAQLGPLSCQHDRRAVKTSFISGQRDTVDRLYLMIWISGGSRGSRSWSPALKNEPNKSRGRAEGFLSGGEKSKHEQLQSGSWQTFGRKRLKTFGRETENISRLNEQQ